MPTPKHQTSRNTCVSEPCSTSNASQVMPAKPRGQSLNGARLRGSSAPAPTHIRPTSQLGKDWRRTAKGDDVMYERSSGLKEWLLTKSRRRWAGFVLLVDRQP